MQSPSAPNGVNCTPAGSTEGQAGVKTTIENSLVY